MTAADISHSVSVGLYNYTLSIDNRRGLDREDFAEFLLQTSYNDMFKECHSEALKKLHSYGQMPSLLKRRIFEIQLRIFSPRIMTAILAGRLPKTTTLEEEAIISAFQYLPPHERTIENIETLSKLLKGRNESTIRQIIIAITELPENLRASLICLTSQIEEASFPEFILSTLAFVKPEEQNVETAQLLHRLTQGLKFSDLDTLFELLKALPEDKIATIKNAMPFVETLVTGFLRTLLLHYINLLPESARNSDRISGFTGLIQRESDYSLEIIIRLGLVILPADRTTLFDLCDSWLSALSNLQKLHLENFLAKQEPESLPLANMIIFIELLSLNPSEQELERMYTQAP